MGHHNKVFQKQYQILHEFLQELLFVMALEKMFDFYQFHILKVREDLPNYPLQ
jgi:hypothetical protein